MASTPRRLRARGGHSPLLGNGYQSKNPAPQGVGMSAVRTKVHRGERVEKFLYHAHTVLRSIFIDPLTETWLRRHTLCFHYVDFAEGPSYVRGKTRVASEPCATTRCRVPTGAFNSCRPVVRAKQYAIDRFEENVVCHPWQGT